MEIIDSKNKMFSSIKYLRNNPCSFNSVLAHFTEIDQRKALTPKASKPLPIIKPKRFLTEVSPWDSFNNE